MSGLEKNNLNKDKIYIIEGQFGIDIKVKKIEIDNEKNCWQVFDPERRKWCTITEKRLIDFYTSILVQDRKVLIEKIKWYTKKR